jgi:hypothetical protein
MEDVLDVYALPADRATPVICLDETTKQLVSEVRTPLPMSSGQVERVDYEYKREGVATLFMMVAPFEGWRHVEVTAQKTRIDYARCLKQLADEFFPSARKIILVQDNLNTHQPCSLYSAFEPAEAQRILSRFQFHYTPKHGSWLNIAEIELSALQSQCLSRRIPDSQILREEIHAWTASRNAKSTVINWRFTASDARIKLKKLYPTIELT